MLKTYFVSDLESVHRDEVRQNLFSTGALHKCGKNVPKRYVSKSCNWASGHYRMASEVPGLVATRFSSVGLC